MNAPPFMNVSAHQWRAQAVCWMGRGRRQS